ncbi:hypothetical protein CWI38_1552p0020 [Hamiltosporidium tvaerminnensis]|uniref:Uncharacterized protein n=1 Tax=Hamiltosporidium tvaerminnensis TaxID=1176355 RepID=A0A4Q9LQH1_9MICR|nr:hypothetical protein CWI38_1552p0020 [Hamiltosporidium tvaerminnensis]
MLLAIDINEYRLHIGEPPECIEGGNNNGLKYLAETPKQIVSNDDRESIIAKTLEGHYIFAIASNFSNKLQRVNSVVLQYLKTCLAFAKKKERVTLEPELEVDNEDKNFVFLDEKYFGGRINNKYGMNIIRFMRESKIERNSNYPLRRFMKVDNGMECESYLYIDDARIHPIVD